MITPGTTKLTFNISPLDTDANKTLVKNLGRNVIRKLVMNLESNEIISIVDCDIFYSYYDCWKSMTERRNAVFQGIVEAGGQTENAIKHRINVGDKESYAKDETVASIFENKFCIPLDFKIIETGIPLYQYGLGSRLTYESTFADYSDVIKSTENAIKHRVNVGDKENYAKDETVASIFENKFCIPLDFKIIETGSPLYQYGSGSR